MKVGELFIELGAKVTDKTTNAITGVQKGLKQTSGLALETKAALVGAFYALQQVFATSGKTGTDLTNLNRLLGVNTKTLQQYQYAARQVGLSNQEMDNTFKTLQQHMTKTLMGEGAPKGLARVAQLVGDFSAEDIARFVEKPEELLQKLQQYAQKETNTGLRNEVLKSFGISDGMIAGLNRMAFRPDVLSRAPTYSEGEVKSLDKANIAWSNLGTKIEMAIGRFNAMHGGQLVTDITKLTDQIFKLADAFLKVAENAKAFEKIGLIFKGWELIFTGMNAGLDKLMLLKGLFSDDEKEKAKAEAVWSNMLEEASLAVKGMVGEVPTTEDVKDAGMGFLEGMAGMVDSLMEDPKEIVKKQKPVKVEEVKPDGAPATPPLPATPGAPRQTSPGAVAKPEGAKVFRLNFPAPTPEAAIRPTAPAASGVSGTTQNIDVQQTLNFHHDGTDPKQTGDSVKKAVSSAYRQMGAQSQGS